MMTIQCDAILFDMDGTLVDSTPIVERLWRQWAFRQGLSPEAILAVAHGRRTREVVQQFAPHLDVDAEVAQMDRAEEHDRNGLRAVPGAKELISSLEAREWALVTSAHSELARVRLQSVGLPLPHILIGAESVRLGKPDPEGYLLAARRMGYEPARCLVIEDTPAGLQAGLAGGMQVLGITTTYPAARLGRVPVVADLRAVQRQQDRTFAVDTTFSQLC